MNGSEIDKNVNSFKLQFLPIQMYIYFRKRNISKKMVILKF